MNKDQRQIILSRFLETKGVKNRSFKEYVVTKKLFKEKVKTLSKSEIDLIFKDLKPLTKKELVDLYDEFDTKKEADINQQIKELLDNEFPDTDDKDLDEKFEKALNNLDPSEEISADDIFGKNPESQDPENQLPSLSDSDGDDSDGDDSDGDDSDGDDSDGDDSDSDDSDSDDSDGDDSDGDDSDGDDSDSDDSDSDDSDGDDSNDDSLERQIEICQSQNIRLDEIFNKTKIESKRDDILAIQSFNQYQINVMQNAIDFESEWSQKGNVPYEFKPTVESLTKTTLTSFKENQSNDQVAQRNQLIFVRILLSAVNFSITQLKDILPKRYLTKEDIQTIKIDKSEKSVYIKFSSSDVIEFNKDSSPLVLSFIKDFNDVEMNIEKINAQLRQETMSEYLTEVVNKKMISLKDLPKKPIEQFLSDSQTIIT